MSFPSPGLGSLTIESGVHRWRPTPSQDADLPELRFRLPGGEISEPLVVRLEAGGGSVPLAQLVPPPPAEALRTAALEGLARWDPRDLLAPAVTGDHVSVARRVLEHPVMADYLAIEANVIQTLETRPNFTPPGLDRVLLIDAYLTYAGQPSPIRLAHAPPRARVWRHGFWPIPIPRYDGLVVMSDGARIFSYDHAGEASSTHDPTGLIGGNFGTRPLRAPELPPGPCWLEVYSNLWREMTYAAVWVNDHGPFFLAERHRADPAQDLAEYIQRTPGPFPEPNPDHQLLRVRLPGGVVRPEDPLSHPDGGANTLRIELRSWATPTDIMNPWAFLHGYGVRPLDAVPLPPGASDG